jgi:hypothetical protein
MSRSLRALLLALLLPLAADAATIYGLIPVNGRVEAVIISSTTGEVQTLVRTPIPVGQTIWSNSIFDPASLRWFVHVPQTDIGGLYVVDLKTGTTTRVALSLAPPENYVDLAYDPAADALYGLMQTALGTKLTAIDYHTGLVIPLIDVPSIAVVTPGQAFDPATGRFFYSSGSNFYVFNVHTLTTQQTAIAPPGYSLNMTFDTATNRLFGLLQDQNPARAVIVDPVTVTFTTIAVPGVSPLPDVPIAYDSTTDELLLITPRLINLRALHRINVATGTQQVIEPLSRGERFVIAVGPALVLGASDIARLR